jgi:iron complex transport system substrate-binding protein
MAMPQNIRQIIWNVLVITAFIIQAIASPAIAKTLTDQLGHRVTLPHTPQRIISLAPSITEIIFAVGQEHRLRGVSRFSDYPLAAAMLPKVGSYTQPDLERIVALNPDLCIATKDGNPKRVIDRLRSLNIPVYAVDPRNLDTVMSTILDIGTLLDASERAKALVESMRQKVETIKSVIKKARSQPLVFFQIGISPIVSIGTDSFINELIVLAGGKNVAAGDIAYPRFSREQVLAFSPEVIIITSMARDVFFEKVKADWNRWPNIPAVRNQRIHLVDSNVFDRPSPRLVAALEVLAKLIHPELFRKDQ